MGKKKKQQQKHQDNQQTINQQKKQQTHQPKQQSSQNQQPQKIQKPILQPKKVSYCPICTLSFQLCRYGKKAQQCMKFLHSVAPTKVLKYHPNAAEYLEKEQIHQEKQDKKEQKKQKDKSIKSKYIVIDVKQRAKKKFTTTIQGLQNYNIDSKQLAKKCSKKYACSSSSIDVDTTQIQGDVYQQVKELLIQDYKVKSKYVITKQKFMEKQKQQAEKRKQQKKNKDNVINQDRNQDQQGKKDKKQPKQQQSKKVNQNNDQNQQDQQEQEQEAEKVIKYVETKKLQKIDEAQIDKI